MIDTASKDVLQKSGLSSAAVAGTAAVVVRTSGRLGGAAAVAGTVPRVVVRTVVVVVVVVVVGVGVAVTAVLVVGAAFGTSGLSEVGLYTGMSPHILSFFEPVTRARTVVKNGVKRSRQLVSQDSRVNVTLIPNL